MLSRCLAGASAPVLAPVLAPVQAAEPFPDIYEKREHKYHFLPLLFLLETEKTPLYWEQVPNTVESFYRSFYSKKFLKNQQK